MSDEAAPRITSPRLRGEVDARSAAGEGGSPHDVLAESPPHPDPLPAGGERETSRHRRRVSFAAIVLLSAVAAAGATWIHSLGPVPLGQGLEFSTVVVDREDRLLRPYATADGRWRLPVAAASVDSRYLDALVSYEDKRFRSHWGVDPWALARAAVQLVRHGRIVSGASTLTMQVAR